MKIKLTVDWLGHKPGSILDLRDQMAKILLARGSALTVEDSSVSPSIQDLSGKQQKPKRNKMVTWGLNK